MKKLIISILLITLILSSMMFNISADHSLKQAEAEALLIAAYHRWFMFQWGSTTSPDVGVLKSNGGFLEEDFIKLDSSSVYQMNTLFEKKGDGTSYKYASTPTMLEYVPITDPRFNTMEKCYDYLEEVFTDEWAYKILNLHWYRGLYGNGEQYVVRSRRGRNDDVSGRNR